MARAGLPLALLALAPWACAPASQPAAAPLPCAALSQANATPRDTQVYDTLALTQKPERITAPRADDYPRALREAGINGRVVVDIIIDASGHAEPGSERVISVTHRDFIAPTLRIIRESQFCPGTIDGRPVRARIRLPMNFSVARAGPG